MVFLWLYDGWRGGFCLFRGLLWLRLWFGFGFGLYFCFCWRRREFGRLSKMGRGRKGVGEREGEIEREGGEGETTEPHRME